MAAIKFSDYLGLKQYKKANKIKYFIHLRLASWKPEFPASDIVWYELKL